jgi:HEAT repeat protein
MINSLRFKVSAQLVKCVKTSAPKMKRLFTLLPSACLCSILVSPVNASNKLAPAILSYQAISEVTQLSEEDDGYLASVFSGTGILVVIGLGLFGLLVSRKLNARANAAELKETERIEVPEDGNPNYVEEAPPTSNAEETFSTPAATNSHAVVNPASEFGSYRIEQEVKKLLLDQPHHMDVLASRVTDDRRAIEASLLRGLSDVDVEVRRRAQHALEGYGFVARECAMLLLADDPFERTSAARTLGEIKSAAALTFLLEALYDSESIVRNQAVISIGELRIPAAIGALLDMARRHPDVPSSLISRALSSCSLEGLDFFDAAVSAPAALVAHTDSEVTPTVTAANVEQLPHTSKNEDFLEALKRCDSENQLERTEAAKTFAKFKVKSSVAALFAMALYDQDETVRSTAIVSLAAINHSSVFPAFLMGLADDSLEVRAAALRSLNQLSFDRADAYIRLTETAAPDFLAEVAKACLKSGIAGQSVDRLASSDRREAYESFAVISLLAKARMAQPVLSAIASHANNEVRLLGIQLLAMTGEPEIVDQFRELSSSTEIPRNVQAALLDAMTKLEALNEDVSGDTVSVVSQIAQEKDALAISPVLESEPKLEVETAAEEMKL